MSGDLVDDAVLAGEAHLQPAVLAPDVAAQQRGRAKALVVAGILRGCRRGSSRSSSRRTTAATHPALVQACGARSSSTWRAELRQRLAEIEAAGIFAGVLLGAEIGMVAILLAAPGIDADRLDMAVGDAGRTRRRYRPAAGRCAFSRSISSRSVMRLPAASK